jgi:hypothetical protein
MHTQLAYQANLTRIDDLKRQAAAHRRTAPATRTRLAFRSWLLAGDKPACSDRRGQ